MTEALIPDTAMVSGDDFKTRLPEGWYVRGYRAEVEHDWRSETRHLYVDLIYVSRPSVEVSLELTALPDWGWLARFLVTAQECPPTARVYVQTQDRPY